MIGLLCFVVAVLSSAFRSKIRLEAENATLRHQLVVLRRKQKGRARLMNNDRWFFVQLYRWFPSILSSENPLKSLRIRADFDSTIRVFKSSDQTRLKWLLSANVGIGCVHPI
jgi:hypothetical protein